MSAQSGSAVKSGQGKHAELRQRVYLQFLYAKTAMCSRAPEFAAYFRRAIPEVW